MRWKRWQKVSDDMISEDVFEDAYEVVQAGPASDAIERYWQEKLDKRPRRQEGAEGAEAMSLLEHMLSMN